MPTIYIENQPYEVADGQNLLNACLALGFDIPYFCWHPAMNSVGACRQCAVKLFKDEQDTVGRIVMSCMTPALEGTRISIDDPEVRAFRASVIELLMINHPHDCPVCDEGGECHLQDMTRMTGHSYRRYRFDKRTYRNQDLGPLVTHEMNRCIQCYRCVRFYRDYAGGDDLNVFGWHDNVYFGRATPGRLQSEFSGNLVEVCPTGVFTDKTLAGHYTRKWDLATAPSVCVHCGVGCNTLPGEREGKVRRVRSRFNADVNGYFLCDRGRYGYEFVNSPRRLKNVLARPEGLWGKISLTSPEDALQSLSAAAAAGQAIGIGSPRATLESNFALRQLVGAENFYSGSSPHEASMLAQALELLRTYPVPSASLGQLAKSEAVIVLGEDITNSAPMKDLAARHAANEQARREAGELLKIPAWDDGALRNAMQGQRGPLFIATPAPTKLDAVATAVARSSGQELARLAMAIAHELDSAAPAVRELSPDQQSYVHATAGAVGKAKSCTVIAGISSGAAALKAAFQLTSALQAAGVPCWISLTVPECNSMGMAMMAAKSMDHAADSLRTGKGSTLIVLENDLYRRLSPEKAQELLSAARRVVVLDHTETSTSARADMILPAATFAEGDGTLVNDEARAQRMFQVFPPNGQVRESWRWLGSAGQAAGIRSNMNWRNLDDVLHAMARELPQLAGALRAAPPGDLRLQGQPVPRQPHRYSGRTAIFANRSVHEPPTPPDVDSPLAFTMEGYSKLPPAPLVSHYYAPGWNSVQALSKFQIELGLGLHAYACGRRLIEPAQGSPPPYADAPPPQRRNDQWLVVGLHHIFGSEELSVSAGQAATLACQPYAAMNEQSARRLGLAQGQEVVVVLGPRTIRVPLQMAPGLGDNIVGLPVGVGDLANLALPEWGAVHLPGERT